MTDNDKMREALCDAAMQPTLDEIVRAAIAHGVEDAPNPKNEMRHKRIASMVRALFAERWQAAQAEAVPVCDGNYADGALYKVLDDLYARGWEDLHKERYYDPRGTVEWQAVLDIFARATVPVVGEPVAWRCKDYGDGWLLAQNKGTASAYQSHTGCLMQALIVEPIDSITAAELERLRKIRKLVKDALDSRKLGDFQVMHTFLSEVAEELAKEPPCQS